MNRRQFAGVSARQLLPHVEAGIPFSSTFSATEECWGRGLLIAAIFSGIFLLMPLVTAGPLALDEHVSYWMVSSDRPATILERTLNYGAVPPLSTWVESAFLTAFGKSEFVFRLPSALCYLLAIGAMYIGGRHIAGPIPGGLGALVLAWYPDVIDEVRIARGYGLLLLWSVILLWSTCGWLRSPGSVRWTILWTIAAAAMIWTHYTAGLVIAVSAVWIGGQWVLRRRVAGNGRSIILWLIAMIVVGGISLPLLSAVFRLQAWGPFLNFMAAGQPFWHVIGPVWWAGLPLGLVVVRLLDSRSARLMPGKTMPLMGGRVAWAGVGMTAMVLAMVSLVILAWMAGGDLPTLANPRYRIAVVPAAAAGFVCLFSPRYDRRLAGVGLAVVLATGWFCAPLLPWQSGRLGHAGDREWMEAAQMLQAEARPEELIFVQSGLVESRLLPAYVNDRLFQEYTACRLGRFYLPSQHRRYGLPFLWAQSPDLTAFYADLLQRRDEHAMRSFHVVAATDTDLARASLQGLHDLAIAHGFEATVERIRPHVTSRHYQRK